MLVAKDRLLPTRGWGPASPTLRTIQVEPVSGRARDCVRVGVSGDLESEEESAGSGAHSVSPTLGAAALEQEIAPENKAKQQKRLQPSGSKQQWV